MKNRKLIKKIAATVVCSAMAFTAFSFAAACDGNETTTPHYHTYSTGDDWAYDGLNHWRYATCEHTDRISGLSAHTWGEDDVCTVCGAAKQVIKPTLSEEDEEPPVQNPDGTITVKYEFTATDFDAVTLEDDVVSGIFTVVKGTTIRGRTPKGLYDEQGNVVDSNVAYTKSVKFGDDTSAIKFTAPAAGHLVLHIQNGSSGATTQSINVTYPDNTIQKVTYRGEGGALQLVEIDLPKAGEYTIKRTSGTSDIFYMAYTGNVEDSPVESIRVASTGNAKYFVGQDFSIDGLAVNAIHETGMISPVATGRLSIDYSNFNSSKSGTYEIVVSYTKEGKTYETSYDVNVYSFEDLTLETDKIVQGSNTSYSNGVYENHSLRQFYFTGEELSDDGISVILNGMIDGEAQDFLLKNTQYKVSEVDMSTAGKKTVTVSYTTGGKTISKTFDIIVADKDPALATATSVDLSVNAATTAANVGVKNGEGAYQFQTIHQALEFLENSGLSKTAKKTITLAAGTYWEKLEVTVPNLTIVGAGKDTTKIEYDALYGVKDAGGFEHTTDSTATLNVREAAENFTIKNVTVSNYYNSEESYVGAASNDHRALALLVQADKFTMDGCALLGYQDTVEFFTGRQLLINTYIAGTTDFIFGTNNTTYFYNCEIHAIYNSTNGGYLTAFKGCNKGADDAVTYGAIFDKCTFTADEGVSGTAIGRPWGIYAAVAVINSTIDGHVSKAPSTGASSGERYVAMSGALPTDPTVKFVEYNNTGAGAIDSTIAGMTYLTAEQAANYNNLSVIFGTTNGGVKYSDVWEPIMPGVETHEVNVYTDEGVLLGTITVEDGKAIKEEQIASLVVNNSTYGNYDIVGVYSDEECQTEYAYAAVSADGNIYVALHFETAFTSSATVTLKQDANYASLAESGKLVITPAEGSDTAYQEIKTDCIGFKADSTVSFEVKAGTTITIDAYGSGYTNFTVLIDGVLKTDIEGAGEGGVLTDDCSFTVDGNCTVTIVNGGSASASSANYLKSITIDVPHTYAHGETMTLTDYDGDTIQNGAIGKWNGIIIDTTNDGANNGKFSNRGSDIQCNVGTVLTFNVEDGVTADDITVISYQNTPVAEGTWSITVEGGVATLKCIGNASNHNYIMAIQID